ncbi:hypothetical protein B0H10DRAFT_2017111 [Mycena sp. CBHHK59/15]|nr:hypothetical protein B0H10DRAFT_2017111 [Mycena sp. CBHHK59/15]
MPRRPRPFSRSAPRQSAAAPVMRVPSQTKPISLESDQSESDNDEVQNEDQSSNESDTSDAEKSDPEDNDDDDVDAPRITQWVDEDELDIDSYNDEDASEQSKGAGPSQLKSLEHDLSNLPLGALLRAQRALTQANASESEDDDNSSECGSDAPLEITAKGKEKEKQKPEWSIEPRRDIAKRAHKHAPVEVTSKRPVTRRRTVVEVKTVQPRDPRFLPLAGEFLPQKFQEQYGFLADAHKDELRTLRDNLKLSRKRLASSPRDLRADREAEVSRLEMAVKRAESLVNRDRRAKVEQETLTKITEEERAKRKQGKGGWWMKEAEKKELLVRARYDALAAEGGKRAVKKAIEKKQKKLGQKEKKSRPFAKGSDLKRTSVQDEGGRPEKRQRV